MRQYMCAIEKVKTTGHLSMLRKTLRTVIAPSTSNRFTMTLICERLQAGKMAARSPCSNASRWHTTGLLLHDSSRRRTLLEIWALVDFHWASSSSCSATHHLTSDPDSSSSRPLDPITDYATAFLDHPSAFPFSVCPDADTHFNRKLFPRPAFSCPSTSCLQYPSPQTKSTISLRPRHWPTVSKTWEYPMLSSEALHGLN